MRSAKLNKGPQIERRVAITQISLPRTQRKAAVRSTLAARASSNGAIRIGINGGLQTPSNLKASLLVLVPFTGSSVLIDANNKAMMKGLRCCPAVALSSWHHS